MTGLMIKHVPKTYQIRSFLLFLIILETGIHRWRKSTHIIYISIIIKKKIIACMNNCYGFISLIESITSDRLIYTRCMVHENTYVICPFYRKIKLYWTTSQKTRIQPLISKFVGFSSTDQRMASFKVISVRIFSKINIVHTCTNSEKT